MSTSLLGTTSFATINQWPITNMTIHIPKSGTWVADVEALIQPNENITGKASLVLNGQVFQGWVFRGGLTQAVWKGRVVGGAGNLGKLLTPKYYKGATAFLSISDALKEGNEVISSDLEVSVLNVILPRWTRMAKSLGAELTALTQQVKTTWRIRKDGKVWVGIDTGIAFGGTYLELDFLPENGKLEIIPTSLEIYPGMSIQGHKISSIVHHITEEDLRTEVFLEDV